MVLQERSSVSPWQFPSRSSSPAVREYEELGERKRALDTRLAEVAQTIGTLSRLCGLTPTVPMGLTDACRLVMRGAGVPISWRADPASINTSGTAARASWRSVLTS